MSNDMYDGAVPTARGSCGERKQFLVTAGIHQALGLSPFLFTMVLDALTESSQRGVPWHLPFTDDVVLVGDRKEEVKEDAEKHAGAYWKETA
uniref:Reverse transcriptase domain-containing protein n=1 Tax=Chelonoidis abingdonii TaxID=106734 RepID=A0A8C0H994_CHEAB